MVFTVGLGPFGPAPDRFCPGGYRDPVDLAARVEMARKVKGLGGLELHSHMFEEVPMSRWKKVFQENRWICSIVSVNVWGTKKWANGSLTNPDPSLRKEAVQEIKRSMDLAREVGAGKINLWLGQDGHWYPFQTDYRETWSRIIDGVSECAHHDPGVQICLEYKLKEPMPHMAVASVGKTLYLVKKINLPNIGCNLDVGHALECYESPAESAVLLANEKALFHLHLDDNYGEWDWDMMTGSVRFWDLLELCFWLEELEWRGPYSFDLFPSREDPIGAVEANIEMVKGAFKLLARLDRTRMLAIFKKRDYVEANRLLREVVFR